MASLLPQSSLQKPNRLLMAEETVHLPDSPYVNRSWRRISTRKLSFLYTEEKILPNYLKSTGSCHDVCKYGTKQHEPKDKPSKVSPLKRVNRSFSGTLSFDNSPLKKKKKALTKSVLNPSLGSGKTKKTVSHTFKTVVVSRRRELEMVEHNKRVTALKLKSVAQTAAMALCRSTANRKKTNGVSTMASKRCSKRMKTKKESNVPIVDETCKDLVDEEKTLYVIKMRTENEIVESDDQNQRCVMDSPTDDLKSEMSPEEDECTVTEADVESSQEEEEQEEDENTPRQGKSKALSVNSKSMKLRFKRGKYSDVGSQDNIPRKLKFKRGKIITGVDTNTKSGGPRRLKTKGTNLSNDKEQEHKARSFKVVLKHQETQKKGDSRVLLFNKVIKKTAIKLVETRKSKVKALVGAFESVISLQEKRKTLIQQHNTQK